MGFIHKVTANIDNLEKDQIDLLKVVLRKVEEAEQAAEDYDKWMIKNQVQALLSVSANRFAGMIKFGLEEIKGVIY